MIARLLRQLPIRRKLVLISMVTSGIALVLTCGAFIAYEQHAFRRDLKRALGISAEIIGYNSASSLAFQDAESARHTLGAFAAQPGILRACIYDPEGAVFATYLREDVAERPWPEARFSEELDSARTLELFHVIRYAGETSGVLYMEADLAEVYARWWRYLAIAGGVLSAALFLTWLIALRLQGLISEPIGRLARLAERVGGERNYALRAEKAGDDEIGRLVEGFNHMLSQIQARDVELHAAHHELEQRVEERTRSLEQARQELVHEKERFQFIFDHIPVGVSLYSLHGEADARHLINPAHLRICGLTLAEAADPGVFKRISHPDDYARQQVLQERLGRGEIDHFSVEKRYLRPDGVVVWVVFSAQRKSYADGRVESLSTVVDITDMKRVQDAVARERARFKFIFDSLPVGVSWRQIGDKTSALFNAAHDAITGVAGARIDASASSTVFQQITHPDDLERQRVLVNKLLDGEIDHYTIEKRYLRADGSVVWVVMTSRMSEDPETGTRQSVTTLVDITDLKRAQEETARERARFKFIFDSLPVGVAWMVHGRAETRIVNAALVRVTGVPVEECQDIRRYAEVTHPDDRVAQAELVAKLKRGEIDQYTMEKRYRRADGDWNHAELTVRLLPLPGTDEAQELATIVDITARKRAEAELESTHRQLLETSRQAGMAEVATGVLHNVGNVLNSVNVSATVVGDLVRRSKAPNIGKLRDLFVRHQADLGRFFTEDPKGRLIPDYLATLADAVAVEQKTMLSELEGLHKNITHIKDIVAMQQSYAKTSGVVETLVAPDLMEDALRMNAGSLARHEVEVVRDYDGRPSLTVEKNKVLQILVNFIGNAKFACAEGGRAEKRITLRVRAEEGGVAFSVGDNGVGIPPENLTRIFAHGFTTRKDGHGFGLHSGALAARELGGSVSVESEGPGRGATFTLRLPSQPEGHSE